MPCGKGLWHHCGQRFHSNPCRCFALSRANVLFINPPLPSSSSSAYRKSTTHLSRLSSPFICLMQAYSPSKTRREEQEEKQHMTQLEELVQQCDMEVMKMAMLKHEQTFRQQVHDLHRLYRVQKQLMGDQSGRPSVPPCRQVQRRRQHPGLSLQFPVDDDEYEHTVVSGGTGRLATPPSTESEDELELTLAVGGVHGGGSRSQRRRRESATDCSDRRSPQTPSSSTDSDEALRSVQHHHQRAAACDLRGGVMVSKQPQWLVRCLSLRMA